MTFNAGSDDLPVRDPEMARLVARTRGLQPWRRLFHAATGLVLALLPTRIGLERMEIVWALGGLLAGLLAADMARLRARRLNALFFSLFTALASPREAARIASSTWYVAGAFLAYALFPLRFAVPAILVLALADPAASAAGRLWGKRRLGKGTVLGSMVFLMVSFAVLCTFVGSEVAFAAAVLVTFVEVVPWRLDDNLTVPLTGAVALWLIGA